MLMLNIMIKDRNYYGRQDVTLVNATGCQRIVKVEHYVIVSFPRDSYIDHGVPNSNSHVANEILSVIRNTNSIESLSVLVCDSTNNNNTGKRNGIIRKLEESLGRPLQWLVCLLHFNELPFRKYFATVDIGTTTDLSSPTGMIASVLDYDPKDLKRIGVISKMFLCINILKEFLPWEWKTSD